MLILFVANGPTKGKVIELSDEIHLIGRQSEEVQLNDSRVSRRHAELIPGDNGWLIRDVGSSNGTAVNGKWLAGDSPVSINAGDRIQVGRTLMIVGDGDSRVMPKVKRPSRSKSKSRSSSKRKAEAESIAPPVEEPVEQVNMEDELAAMLGSDEDESLEVAEDAAPLPPTLDDAVDDSDDDAPSLSLEVDSDDDDDLAAVDTAPAAAGHDESASIEVEEDDDRLELTVDEPEAVEEAAAAPAEPDVEDPLDAIELSDEADDDDEEILIASEDSLAGIEVDLTDDVESADMESAQVASDDIAALAAARDSDDDLADRNEEPAEALLDASLVDDPESDDAAIADVARVLYPGEDSDDDALDEQALDVQVDDRSEDDALAPHTEAAQKQRDADVQLVEEMDEQIGEDRLDDTDAHTAPAEDASEAPAAAIAAAAEDVQPTAGDEDIELESDEPEADEPDDRVAASFADLDAMFADLDSDDDDTDDNHQPTTGRAQAMHFSPYDEGQPQLDAHAEDLDTATAIADPEDSAGDLDTSPAVDLPPLDDRGMSWGDVDAVGDMVDPPAALRDVTADEPTDGVDVSTSMDIEEPVQAFEAVDASVINELVVDADAGRDVDADAPAAPMDVAAVLGVTPESPTVDDEPDITADLHIIDAGQLRDEDDPGIATDTMEAPEEDKPPHEETFADTTAPAADAMQAADEAALDEQRVSETYSDAAHELSAPTASHAHEAVMDVAGDDDVVFDDVEHPAQDEPDDEDIRRAALASPDNLADEPIVDEPATLDDDSVSVSEPVSDDVDASAMEQAFAQDLAEDDGVVIEDRSVPEHYLTAVASAEASHDLADDDVVIEDRTPADLSPAIDEPAVEAAAVEPPPVDEAPSIDEAPTFTAMPVKPPRPSVLQPAVAEGATPRPPNMSPTTVPTWDIEEAQAQARRLHPAWKVLIPVVIAVVVVVGGVELNNRFGWIQPPSQLDSLDQAIDKPQPTRLDQDLEAARRARAAVTPAPAVIAGPDASDPVEQSLDDLRQIVEQAAKNLPDTATPRPADPRD